MTKPTEPTTAWTGTAKALHWTMALAILLEVPVGYVMGRTYMAKDPATAALHKLLSQTHQTLGLLLLAAVLFRLYWRLTHAAPALPATTSAAASLFARAAQAALYALLLLIPLAGWAALSALADSPKFPHTELWFFAHDGFGPHGLIPRLVPPVAYNAQVLFKYGFFAHWHVWLLWAGLAILAAHIGGALRHHFVLKDNVLTRFLPGKTR